MLADVGGKPLIVRTFESAIAADAGDVVVACDGSEISSAVESASGKTVLTNPDLPSGTDRVFSGWTSYDPEKKYRFIVNLQGDLPFIAPEFIRTGVRAIKETNYDIFTLATPIRDDSHLRDSVVKPVIAYTSGSKDTGRALYFSRSAIPSGGPFFHHIGIYCFRAEGLEKFVSLPQSPLEKSEKLEQLRALENDMTIGISVIDMEPPVSVDTAEDLELARRELSTL
jgi:3-deoxy-manno-octulosonate cytidylyltransferase (CMP-KDO synthetase)